MLGARGARWSVVGVCTLTFLTGASAQQAVPGDGAAGEEEVRLQSALVTLDVTVEAGHGRFVPGLEQEHFRVYDDDAPQTVSFFGTKDMPVTVGIVYDTSASMKLKTAQAVAALRGFLETCHPDDEYFLVGVGSRPELMNDFAKGQGFADRLSLLTPGGETALYDAVALALEKAQHGHLKRRALLVVSDGEDTRSRYTVKELREMAQESDVQVYAICTLDRDYELAQYGANVLTGICAATGGRALFPRNAEQLADCCALIALELRRQYTIGFYPARVGAERRWHKLKVKLDLPADGTKLSVRTRPGYYAGARPTAPPTH